MSPTFVSCFQNPWDVKMISRSAVLLIFLSVTASVLSTTVPSRTISPDSDSDTLDESHNYNPHNTVPQSQALISNRDLTAIAGIKFLT